MNLFFCHLLFYSLIAKIQERMWKEFIIYRKKLFYLFVCPPLTRHTPLLENLKWKSTDFKNRILFLIGVLMLLDRSKGKNRRNWSAAVHECIIVEQGCAHNCCLLTAITSPPMVFTFTMCRHPEIRKLRQGRKCGLKSCPQFTHLHTHTSKWVHTTLSIIVWIIMSLVRSCFIHVLTWLNDADRLMLII